MIRKIIALSVVIAISAMSQKAFAKNGYRTRIVVVREGKSRYNSAAVKTYSKKVKIVRGR